MNWLKQRLVDDWHGMLRWWSVRMTLIGGLLATLLSLMPSMPAEVQAALPIRYRLVLVAVWALAALLSRVLQQKKLGG